MIKIIILVLLIIVLLFNLTFIKINNSIEKFQNNNENYLCYMCVNLSNELLSISNQFVNHYKVFIIVDNNSQDLSQFKIPNNIEILRIDDEKCVKLGYKNANATLKKNPVCWDKVFYYFSNIDTNYKNVWFIEEDVFIPNNNTIMELDRKYPKEDLLCKYNISYDEDTDPAWNKSHWKRAEGKIDKPWHRSLLCCHRQSRRNLLKVKEYVDKNGTLLFLEFMINTIAGLNNHKVQTIPEFQTIHWRKNITLEDIKNNKNNLFHPIKDLNKQLEYKKLIQFNNFHY